MNATDPKRHDYAAARAAATAGWQAEQIQSRLERFYAKRPPTFAVPGELLPDIAAWTDRYAAGDRTGLVLVGNVGVGKSWALWKIHETLIKGGFLGDMEIKTAYDLKRTLTPPIDTAAFDYLANADILALDDVGSIRVSDWDADHLMGLIDTRWSYQRPTLVASNTGKLRDLLGERVASRISDNVHKVKMLGDDRRRAK